MAAQRWMATLGVSPPLLGGKYLTARDTSRFRLTSASPTREAGRDIGAAGTRVQKCEKRVSEKPRQADSRQR